MTMKYPKLMAVLCLFLILAASTFNIQQASMVDGWAGMDTAVHPSTDGDGCTEQSIEVDSSYYQITETQNACVTYGKDIDLASRYFYTEDGVYAHVGVRYKGEDTFVPIWLTGYIYLIPGTNTFIYDSLYYGGRSNAIFILENANNALQPQHSGSDYIYRYTLNENGRKLVFPAPQSNPWYKSSYLVSQDGRYIVANFTERGLFKADIKTGVVTKLLNSSGYGQNWHNNNYVKAVSNDGRFVFLGNSGLIVDTKDCGSHIHSVDAYSDPDVFVTNVCATRDISSGIELMMPLGQLYYGINKAYFIASSNKLVFDAQMWWAYSSERQWRMVELPPPSQDTSSEPKTLSYLALGDSFSSGEGDLGKRSNGHSYYREGTDTKGDKDKGIPRELCHISQRSYPYLLASGMELSGVYADNSEKWTSVACSGATIADMNKSLSNDYVGQDEGSIPRLEGYDRTTLKQQALQYMIPGRQKQVEFVKKYRPNVVTITAGGNDIHFAKIIKACVSPNILDGGEWTSRCSYAKDDAKKANIAFAIMDLQEELVNLYKELKDAGDKNTQLYVLGYPIFVDDKAQSLKCGLNVRLDSAEREMIAESTKFLNQIIRLAASEAGAMYINTENSLGNHKLCGSDSKKAANGITGLWDNAESFHPNHYGHELMANTVWNAMDNESLLGHVCKNSALMRCPSNQHGTPYIPEYFREAIARQVRAKVLQSQGSVPDILQKGLSIPLTILDYTFGSNQISFILLYSERTELGSFTTNNNGGYTGVIQLPSDISPGYHTLEIESVNQNGEPIKLWKIVEIRSEDPDDWDGDGIPNDTDRCLYIQPVGIDEDGDGIDDGCDPEIGSPVDTLKQAIASNRSTYTASKIDENTKRAVLNERPIIDWQGTDQDPNLYESESGTSLHNSDRVGIISIFALGAILVLGISLWIKITQRKK